jgi:hypothetical protein
LAQNAVLKEVTSDNKSDDVRWKNLCHFLETLEIKYFTTDVIFIFREFKARKFRVITKDEFSHFMDVFSDTN